MRYFLSTIVLLAFVTFPALCQDKVSYWPKQAEFNGYVMTIYRPEPEKFENYILETRAAFSIYDGQHLPLFGAMWFRCRVQTNVSSNEVYFTDIQLMNVNFQHITADKVSQVQELIESQAAGWHFNSNLKDFYANLKSLEIRDAYSANLQNSPPVILFSKVPAVLVYIDGAPVLHNFSGSELYQYVVNTPHFIVHSSSDKQYYLHGGDWWYVASDPSGTWKNIETPPAAIRQLAEQSIELRPDNSKEISSGTAPKLISVKEPAELIQTQGEPEISQIHDNLFTVTNSLDEIIFDSNSDYYYILISGRWYKTKNLERGPWAFVEPENLPEAFTKIPPSSPLAHIRLSVPGTPEAESAALDNGIPQTAVVLRAKAKMEISYDGAPVFQEVTGTTLKYAVNTMGSVLQTKEGTCFAVDQGIWFVADNPLGPWQVADHYPDEVKRIPPGCPVFNLKFVHIYDYDEEHVFVGYTGGYLGAFLYHGIVVYGTGYKYKSWNGDKYIPAPNAYTQGAKKKTGNGPNISFYASSGYGGPMMGPGFYGPYGGYGMGMGYGGYGMYNQAAYNQYYYAGQTLTVDHDVVEEKPIDLENIYNNRKEGIVITETVQRNDPMKPVVIEHTPDDLYTDKDGKMYQLDRQGNWLELTADGWKATTANPRQ